MDEEGMGLVGGWVGGGVLGCGDGEDWRGDGPKTPTATDTSPTYLSIAAAGWLAFPFALVGPCRPIG